jgi:RNA polymerase sigma factor (sigma-70 family)
VKDPLGANPELVVADYLKGDPEAVRVVDGWVEAVLRDGFLSLREEWEDMKQEARARVFVCLQRSGYQGRSSLRTFVHRVARNTCIDYVRRSRRHRGGEALDEETLDQESPAVGTESPEMRSWAARRMLARLMEGLPEEDRLMIQLVFQDFRSYAEVAAILNIPEGTVKSRVSRLRDRLLARRRDILAGSNRAKEDA